MLRLPAPDCEQRTEEQQKQESISWAIRGRGLWWEGRCPVWIWWVVVEFEVVIEVCRWDLMHLAVVVTRGGSFPLEIWELHHQVLLCVFFLSFFLSRWYPFMAGWGCSTILLLFFSLLPSRRSPIHSSLVLFNFSFWFFSLFLIFLFLVCLWEGTRSAPFNIINLNFYYPL